MNKKQVVRLTESDLRRIVANSVQKILTESYEGDTENYEGGSENIVSQFAAIITNCDANTAEFIARELAMDECCKDKLVTIIEHMNGYGYGGPDINGNTKY